MTPTILVAGATGNTGKSVVETLSTLLPTSPFADHRILALTRSLSSPTAQTLAKLPHVTVIEQSWVEVTPAWLREHFITRAFIASHNEPNQFAEESQFHVSLLQAGVKYVVRISTTAANMFPSNRAYYPRSHWAIEQLLSSPEFGELHWTSLQPNIFSNFYLATAAGLIGEFRKTGKQGVLRLIADEGTPVGVIAPSDVGIFAAHLLLSPSTVPHNNKKYVLNGPVDITGKEIVSLVEKYIGEKVEEVVYKDLSFLEYMVQQQPNESRNVIMSIQFSPETAWEGKCTTATTSREFLEIAAPKGGPEDVLRGLIGEE